MGIEMGLEGRQSIDQAIRNIILTEKGSVPLRPNFGLGVEKLLGGVADKMKMRKEILEQLIEYEPRIEVKKILIRDGDIVGHYKVSILYKIKETGEEASTIMEGIKN